MSYYPQTQQSVGFDDLNLDLGAVQSNSLIPKGEYQLQAVETKVEYSSAGHRTLKAQFQVLGGDYDNRRIFENFSLEGNPTAVEIGLRNIKQWVVACGYSGNERLTMDLIRSLEGREFIASVYVQEDKKGQYDPQNRLRGYKPLPGAGGEQQPPQRATAQAPSQRANNASAPFQEKKPMPWETAR